MESITLSPEDCKEDMLFDLKNGKERGTTTYIEEFDDCWTWRNGEANIWTGMSGEGKSEFLRFITLIKSLEEDWKFTFNSPEEFPAKEFYDSLINSISGKTTDKNNEFNELISEEIYLKCLDLIKDNFKFVYIKPPHNTVENCLKEFQKIHDKTPQNAFIMDPIMKFQKSKDAPERDDQYATYIDTLITDFARINNVSIHLVIHQLTPRVNEMTKLYDKPSPYQIKGGGSWVDGIDNVLYVWRPQYAKNRIDTSVTVGSLKIKKQKLTGIPGDVNFKFNRKTNRYVNANNPEQDLYNFDKWLEPTQKPKLRF